MQPSGPTRKHDGPGQHDWPGGASPSGGGPAELRPPNCDRRRERKAHGGGALPSASQRYGICSPAGGTGALGGGT